ncbi:MAG: hypothetical protein IJW70_11090 [Clostridia bacterium]|nr:hypothetical protein [Clostridia bacterium]
MIESSDSVFKGLIEELFGTGSSDIIGGSDVMSGAAVTWVLLIALFIVAAALTVALAVYVIEAVAIMRMAKGLRVERPWLAWIPIAQAYTMGQIAERCDERRGIAIKPWGKILLFTHIGYAVVSVVYSVASGVLPNLLLIGYLLLLLLWAVNMIASAAYWVMNYICIWKMFREYYPKTVNIVVFVASIVFSAHHIGMLVAGFFPLRPSVSQELEEELYTY